MFRNSTLIILFATIALTATSCKKWLDLQPQDGITRQKFWQTKEQVQAAVNGIYASLLGPPSGVGDRALAEYLFLWGELRADMITSTTGITNEEQDVINVNILPTNSITNWRSVYRTINYCNTVIDFAPQVLKNDPTFSEQALKAYVSEARAIRALMYFYLVRSFGDVPLKLKATTSDDEIEPLPKSPQQDVLNQIVNDLKEAETYAVFTYNNQATDKGRITRYSIWAMQADVYLWMEKYNEVLAACNKITASGKFGLLTGTNSWFYNLFANGNTNESIFEFQFDRQKLNPFYPLLMTSRRHFMVSTVVMDEMYTVDMIDDTKKDIRGDGAAVRASDGTVWKYMGWTSATERLYDESYAHWFVYRYADVLLMKAEALALLKRGREALEIVYFVRDRAHALAATDRAPNDQDINAITDFILEERAREFAFEGKRWYDVLRHAKRDNYARIDLLLNMVSISVAPDRQQSAIAKYQDHNSHYFPIYDYELQTDQNLVQNPFYK
jgi:starch-binding outer membrane protein, SusD/RagB family